VEQNPCTRFGLDLQPLSENCMALCWTNGWLHPRSSQTNLSISIIEKTQLFDYIEYKQTTSVRQSN
jgi:hypothetical protein